MSIKSKVAHKPVLTSSVIVAFAAALLTLLVQFGVPLEDGQADAITGLVMIAAPFVVAEVSRRRTVDKKDVLERAQDGHVLAGEANELPTNTHIREVGDLDAGV